jgi:hypothetical protein
MMPYSTRIFLIVFLFSLSLFSIPALAQQEKQDNRKKSFSVDEDPKAPFPRRFDVQDFPKGLDWLNTKKPLSKRDLKGKFVLLDFWTY